MRINNILIFMIAICLFAVSCKKELSKPEDIKVKSIEVSSTLQPGRSANYAKENLMDGSYQSWCEGAKGDGTGETITINFDKKVIIGSIFIRNGYGNSDYFQLNNRVKTLDIISDGKIVTTVSAVDLNGIDELKFGRLVETDSLTMKIASVYRGTSLEDTCITELAFTKKGVTHLKRLSDVCKESGKFYEFGSCVDKKSLITEILDKVSKEGQYRSNAPLPEKCAEKISIGTEDGNFSCGGPPPGVGEGKFISYVGRCKKTGQNEITCSVESYKTGKAVKLQEFTLQTEKDWNKANLCLGKGSCYEFGKDPDFQ
jgi:hypothetical protein